MPKKAVNKKNKLALAALLLLVLTIIFGKVINFVADFYRPHLWDGQSNINLLINKFESSSFERSFQVSLINSQKVALLIFNPSQNKVMVLNIPDNSYLPVSGNHGSWMLSSIYGLGQSENPLSGNKLLVNSVSYFLGLPIDGYINQTDSKSLVEDVRQNPFKVITLSQKLESNLNKSELFRLLWGISRVRFDKVLEVDLDKYLTTTLLADGSQVLTADPVQIDSLAKNFYDGSIVEGRLEVAIVNATNYPGLAQRGARMVKNIGGNVVITTTSEVKSNNTRVLGKEGRALNRLAQIFNSACLNNPKCDIMDLGLQIQNRADIIIVLGEDFKDRF